MYSSNVFGTDHGQLGNSCTTQSSTHSLVHIVIKMHQKGNIYAYLSHSFSDYDTEGKHIFCPLKNCDHSFSSHLSGKHKLGSVPRPETDCNHVAPTPPVPDEYDAIEM